MAKNKTGETNEAPAGEAPAEGAATATAEAAPAKVKQPQANGVTRPAPGTATGRVWEIFDSLGAAKGGTPARKDVMEAGKAEGLNEATIATQYGRACKFYGVNRAALQAANAQQTATDAPAVEGAPAEGEPVEAVAE